MVCVLVNYNYSGLNQTDLNTWAVQRQCEQSVLQIRFEKKKKTKLILLCKLVALISLSEHNLTSSSYSY